MYVSFFFSFLFSRFPHFFPFLSSSDLPFPAFPSFPSSLSLFLSPSLRAKLYLRLTNVTMNSPFSFFFFFSPSPFFFFPRESRLHTESVLFPEPHGWQRWDRIEIRVGGLGFSPVYIRVPGVRRWMDVFQGLVN